MSHTTVLAGFVKQVISGDTIVIRERACDGPPSSRTVVLSGIACPKVARRPNPNTNAEATADEPFGWAAREFVRTRLIGKEVCYTIENELSPDRAYGAVFLGKNTASPNVAHMLVSEGLARLRRMGNPDKNPNYAHLISLEEEAKSMKKGIWSESVLGTPRNICWSIDSPNQFLDMYSGRPLHGIVEFVRDGSTMQIQLLPIEGDPDNIYYNFMLSLSGVKTPTSKIVDGARVQEPFALDAQFFVESRLLQRDVTVILESLNFQTFIGSVLHPNGNIAIFLLQDGLARCLEWNLAVVSEQAGGAAAYRAAERSAKEKRIRIWRDYRPSDDKIAAPAPAGKAKGAVRTEYAGPVIEVGNGDNLMVKCQDGVVRKFFLSSIRPPRPSEIKSQDSDIPTQPSKGQGQRERARPLYDVPYLFEAREHLRKRLVGKQVKVYVDYVQPKPADSTLDDRVCATVMIGDSNVAESLVQKGLASVVRYKGTADARSRAYDSLLNAEAQASKKATGIYNLKAAPVHRLTDLSGNATKCRDFLPSLKRAGTVDAVVEFVSSASRLRLHIPRENCLCTAVASGLICPRPSRRMPNMPEEAGEPFGDEAYNYTREICMQRDVKFEADSIDRVGGVIGWIHLPAEVRITPPKKGKKGGAGVFSSANLSVILVARGYATVNGSPAAQRSTHYAELLKAETFASEHNMGMWSSEEFRASRQAEMQVEDSEGVRDEDTDQTGRATSAVESGLLSMADMKMALPSVASELINSDVVKRAAASRLSSMKLAQVTTVGKAVAGNNGFRFFVQFNADAHIVHGTNEKLNSGTLALGGPESTSFAPKRGLLCAARFSVDNLWYRARVTRVAGKLVTVVFIDFGNEETIDTSIAGAPRLAGLPKALAEMRPLATEYRLAYVQMPQDSDYRDVALDQMIRLIGEQDIHISVVPGAPTACGKEDNHPVQSALVLLRRQPDTTSGAASSSSTAAAGSELLDVSEELLREGLAYTERLKMPADLCVKYFRAQEAAMSQRVNIWRYGDFREDEEDA